MTININVPQTSTATLQPNFSKVAEYPGFIFYHSLKERYIIKPGDPPDVTSSFESILDSADLLDRFAYLIGNNSNNIYIAQCESGQLAKVQVNPATGNTIAESIIDIRDLVRTELADSGLEVFITSGLVLGNRILLGIAANPAGGSVMESMLLSSEDNGSTWNLYSFAGAPQGMPVSILRINFYSVYYYWFFVRMQNGNLYKHYLISEEDLLTVPLGGSIVQFHSDVVANHTYNANRFAINIEASWHNNAIYVLNDDRTYFYTFLTNLHSGQFTSYTGATSYPVEIFQEEVSTQLLGERLTSINPLSLPDSLFSVIHKVDELINNSSATTDNAILDQGFYTLWNKGDANGNFTGLEIINLIPHDEEVYVLYKDGGSTLRIARGGMFQNNTFESLDLTQLPLGRYNTGPGFVVTGVNVDPLPAGWLANDATSVWISDRADTDTHNYGTLDFDYALVISLDLPIAASVTFRAQYYGEILDISVDGVSTAQSFSGNEGTWINITVNIPRGPSDILFNMRNPANPGPGNPTGLRIEFDNDLDISAAIATNGYSDMLVDTVDDKIYAVFGTFAWKINLAALTMVYGVDLHAEQLVLNPPYPPGWDPVAINGVTDDTHVPLEWKLLKNFGDVYIHNTKHDTTYTNPDPKEFYMWVFDDEDPTGIEMFSAFELDPSAELAKLKYFYDINNQLHIIITRGVGTFTTVQYRLNGLAQFNQLTESPVTVGPIKFEDVYVGSTGKIYVSESDEPVNLQANADMYVYVNADANDIDNGSYLIDYDYQGFNSPNLVALGENNFGQTKRYIEIPGDYLGSFILGSDIVRYNTANINTLNIFPTEYLGGSANTSARISNNAGILVAHNDTANQWLYVLVWDTGLSEYNIYRTRTVFYPFIFSF